MLTEIRRREAGGSITLYLAMSLTALLSLYIVLMRGAGLGAARMQLDSISHIAQNSALAEFHGELHDRYDLFMVDTSYGGPGGGNEVFGQHLRGYMEKNCVRKTALPLGGGRDWTSMQIGDVNVTEGRYACDKAGRAVREQVYAYMSADPAGKVIADFLVTADHWRGLKSGQNVTQEEREAASGNPSEAEDMVGQMDSFQLLPILWQVFGSTDRISKQSVPLDSVLSRRGVHLGTGMQAENTHTYPEADEILFDRYIYEKTGDYTRQSEDGQLRFQTEYILCGKGSDRQNLEDTAARLLLIREASNCLYLFTDEARMAQVHLVAAAASLLLLSPELEDVIARALALTWSYLESVQDVRTLLDGGKVPLQKTDKSWQTQLYELLTPLSAIRDRDSGEGLSYSEYLQGLLLLEGRTIKTQRIMDIMEMDIRKITGCSGFRMDLCLDEFRMHAEVKACGKTFTFDGTGGYN